MRYRRLANLGEVSVLGLGCARLGSMMVGRPHRESLALITAAVNAGITLFDTADIYGQGESERILGEALKFSDARIVTKAGQRFSLSASLSLPFRGVARGLFTHSPWMRAKAGAARAKRLPRNYEPAYLRRALLGSLSRLRREQIDIFLLHSPNEAELQNGEEALDCLVALKQEGLAKSVGISCDDQMTLARIALDRRVEVIEAAVGPNRQDLLPELRRAADRGASVIAREILTCDPQARRPTPKAALSFCLAEPAIAAALIGTTSASHLDEAIRALGSRE